MPKNKYRFHPEALEDVEGILAYGYENHGIEQALKYNDEMHDVLQFLAENKGVGSILQEDKKYKHHPYGEHMILYYFDDDILEVSAIFLQSSEWAKRLVSRNK